MASEKVELPVAERPVEEPTPSPSTEEHEQPQKKSSPLEKITSLFDNWYYAWEILGIFLSGAAIIAICIVVYHFDGNEVPNWTAYAPGRAKPFRLTINSLLSILSVLGSTCAMIPVTKGLGQLKYLWFMEQGRKLADLEVFDSASRGKVGSAQLIWKLRFKHLAVLGGLASLLALAYGPFVQNLLVVEIQYHRADNNALLSYTFSYFYEPINVTGTDSALRFSVEQALKDTSAEWATPANKCKTGECVWEDYYTLAACSRCTDISHLLKRTCTPVVTSSDGFSDTGGCNLALPNGLSFNSTDLAGQHSNPHRTTMVMNTTMHPLVHNYTAPLAFVQSIIGYPHGDSVSNTSKPFIITQDSPVSAHECAIIPCVQRQSLTLTRFTEGTEVNPNLPATDDIIPLMDIIETFDNYTAREDGYVTVDFKDPSENKHISEQQKDKYSQPTILPSTYAGMRNYFDTILNGYVWSSPDATAYSISSLGSAVPSIHEHTLNHTWSPFYCEGNETSQEGVPCGMNKIAAGLTNAFRLWAWQIEDEGSRSVLNGTTKQAEQICTAQWQYVSAPVAVWVLGLALFIGVVIKTRRANIMAWRTSPLATLLLRLDPDSREHLKDWQHMGDAELKAMAQELRLRLQIDESGPRFVRETT
ncbi:hypothetical protein CkaCkLH20_09599 [Colletotrichum karsti]|uniref:Uncharacterized protein n=1 Tax=Colletotrichum karsti TaxID=1095194 RepID=A0A9P6LEF2_9PEZI|nr:uncharacterized protein CkaCkLH20_09599 [Colletotrichum karsti]KAF9873089.1 hypothetical protein CkaCkLH20_09599 [Colletotrichum karsti]